LGPLHPILEELCPNNLFKLLELQLKIFLILDLAQLHNRILNLLSTTYSVAATLKLQKMMGSLISSKIQTRIWQQWIWVEVQDQRLNKLSTYKTCTRCIKRTLIPLMTSIQLSTMFKWEEEQALVWEEVLVWQLLVATSRQIQEALMLLETTARHLKLKIAKSHLCQWWATLCHKVMLWEWEPAWVWELAWAWIICRVTCSNNQWDTVWTKECSLNLVVSAHNLNSNRTNLETGDSINSKTLVEVSTKHNNHHSPHQVLLSTNRSSNQWTKVLEHLSLQRQLKAVTLSITD